MTYKLNDDCTLEDAIKLPLPNTAKVTKHVARLMAIMTGTPSRTLNAVMFVSCRIAIDLLSQGYVAIDANGEKIDTIERLTHHKWTMPAEIIERATKLANIERYQQDGKDMMREIEKEKE